MKKNLVILLIFSFVLITGCMEDKRTFPPVNKTEAIDPVKTEKKDTVAQVPDTSTIVKEATDTICASTKPEEPIQEQTIENMDNSTPVWAFIALTLGAASFLLVLILWFRTSLMYKNLCHDLGHLEHEVDKNYAGISKKLNNLQKDHNTDNMLKLQKRLDDMEKAIDAIGKKAYRNLADIQDDKLVRESADKNGKVVKSKTLRTGYFGVVKTGNGLAMFNDYPKSRNEDAYFEMTYLDDTHCEFAPFDLNRIRAIDEISSAIDYTGSMAYAKEMRVLSMGKAEYNSERDFWRITDKVKIELV